MECTARLGLGNRPSLAVKEDCKEEEEMIYRCAFSANDPLPYFCIVFGKGILTVNKVFFC